MHEIREHPRNEVKIYGNLIIKIKLIIIEPKFEFILILLLFAFFYTQIDFCSKFSLNKWIYRE